MTTWWHRSSTAPPTSPSTPTSSGMLGGRSLLWTLPPRWPLLWPLPPSLHHGRTVTMIVTMPVLPAGMAVPAVLLRAWLLVPLAPASTTASSGQLRQLQAPLLLPGKRPGRREDPDLNGLPAGGSLTYLRDSLTNRDFLVDTGASRSVFPHRSAAPPSGPRLLMADGCPCPAWGSRVLPLQFGGSRFEFSFLLAAVDRPILGANFLGEFGLLVDTSTRRVLLSDSSPLAPPFALPADPAVSSVFKLAPDVSALLDEFPEAWSERPPGSSLLMVFLTPLRRRGAPCSPAPAVWTK